MLLSYLMKAHGTVYNRGGTAQQHLPSPAPGLTGEPCSWRAPLNPRGATFLFLLGCTTSITHTKTSAPHYLHPIFIPIEKSPLPELFPCPMSKKS